MIGPRLIFRRSLPKNKMRYPPDIRRISIGRIYNFSAQDLGKGWAESRKGGEGKGYRGGRVEERGRGERDSTWESLQACSTQPNTWIDWSSTAPSRKTTFTVPRSPVTCSGSHEKVRSLFLCKCKLWSRKKNGPWKNGF